MSEHLNKPPEVKTSEEVINIEEITLAKSGIEVSIDSYVSNKHEPFAFTQMCTLLCNVVLARD